ncbi:NAD-P-binding protein [Rickenella mellea]|uniref:NAD-P-binding protein n=1 Tax=Rickenella mellea TaxID=50990 RepID=A0A4Y7Q450_9AGAM|nr:NAD-P-binding protein [Rickenella mellea]
MHVLVLGGTGPVGILLIQELLAASHTVVVYARSPGKLPEGITTNPNVTIVKGDLMDREALGRALEGVHAVVSALGPAVGKGPLHPSGTPIAKGYAVLVELMEKHNIKRLIALGTASMKDEHDKFDLQFWVLVNGVATFAHSAYKDVVAIGETIRRSSALIYTIARVPILTNSKKKECVAGYVGDGKTKPWLTRSAFASFVVEELGRNDWIQKAPLLSVP